MQNKQIQSEKIAKEIEEANKISALSKQKKILEEKEEDLKILKYNMEKAKKEEEEMREKKRIQEEKEKELQKLREKQEKAKDKQSELDALRAKRAFEENERILRQKEKEEILLKKKLYNELIIANEKQKKDREMQLIEQAIAEKNDYERIIKNQI